MTAMQLLGVLGLIALVLIVAGLSVGLIRDLYAPPTEGDTL